MSETLTHRRAPEPARDQAHILFAQTMRYGAATPALLGGYLGHSLPGGVSIAAFGAAGYAIRRDPTVAARVSSGPGVALIAFGIVVIFASIPAGALICSVLGPVICADFILLDFQRIRLSRDISSAPLPAASIFLDVLNVFLAFLQIFSREQ